MSLSHKAAISSLFTYAQFVLAMVSGVILFPLVIRSVGGYAYGLWLATGEAVSYVLLSDLGVFSVLPWLFAGRIGAKDYKTLGQYLSDALAIGIILGFFLLVACGILFLIQPSWLGVSQELWDRVRYPTALLLCFNGLCYPLKAFQAFLVGAQDVFVSGCLAIFQNLLLVALTACVVVFNTGVIGLAVAASVPPFIGGLLATIRMFTKHRSMMREMGRPEWISTRRLIMEGLGPWLSGLGFRLMAASNGIILTMIGRPDLGTVYASTGKIAQILNPLCATIPDSGLVGISHVYASNSRERSARPAICLLLLYLVLPSIAAVGLLVANPAFVAWWIAPDLYAGDYVNTLLAINLVIAGLAGGAVKLAAVVGKRRVVGITTLIAGLLYAGLGYFMVRQRELSGLAEAGILVWAIVILPVGAYLIEHLYGFRFRDLLNFGFRRWLVCSIPALVISSWLGAQLADRPLTAFVVSGIVAFAYMFSLRPLMIQAPWPAGVQAWLKRLSLSA